MKQSVSSSLYDFSFSFPKQAKPSRSLSTTFFWCHYLSKLPSVTFPLRYLMQFSSLSNHITFLLLFRHIHIFTLSLSSFALPLHWLTSLGPNSLKHLYDTHNCNSVCILEFFLTLLTTSYDLTPSISSFLLPSSFLLVPTPSIHTSFFLLPSFNKHIFFLPFFFTVQLCHHLPFLSFTSFLSFSFLLQMSNPSLLLPLSNTRIFLLPFFSTVLLPLHVPFLSFLSHHPHSLLAPTPSVHSLAPPPLPIL